MASLFKPHAITASTAPSRIAILSDAHARRNVLPQKFAKATRDEAAAAAAAADPEKLQPLLMTLQQAARQPRSVPAAETEHLLAQLEQHVQSKPGPCLAPGSPNGRWRLVFSRSTSIRFLQYIPVTEDLVVDLHQSRIGLDSVVGPVKFYIR